MNTISQDLILEATRLTKAGRLDEATDTIRRALRSAVGMPAKSRAVPTNVRSAQAKQSKTYDAEAATMDKRADETAIRPLLMFTPLLKDDSTNIDLSAAKRRTRMIGSREEAGSADDTGTGEFVSATFAQSSQTHSYKLFIPPNFAGRQLPLVVMLHGCTQDPDDFAIGTGMNELAREQGFYVLYPAQMRSANMSKCWNWFNEGDQQRGHGEPALLANMTLAVIQEHGIDARRVFVAGLSAGGAMATIVAHAYPEIFAAVGVHSGLRCGAASNMSQAFSAMKNGASPPSAIRFGQFAPEPADPARSTRVVPTIVFHGEQDRTVNPRNGEEVIAAALGIAGGRARSTDSALAEARLEEGVSALGGRYTRSIQHDENGNVLTEHWRVHEGGHAWAGGDARGSYTDATGPDATREMYRFFTEHSQGAV